MLERVLQPPGFRVCCLGAFKIVETQHETDLTPRGRKARALIAYLCLARQSGTRERLAALLWGDRGDDQARASLRQTLYEVRSLPGGDHLLNSERDTLAIGEHVSTDIAMILAAAQSGDLERLADVLSAWRGDVFEDLSGIDPSFDSWLGGERLRVADDLAAACTEAVRAGMARGEHDSARQVVNLLQHRDSANEGVLRLGLTLDSLCGDSAGLHRRYERFRELLRSELDAAPSGETQCLFRALTSSAVPAADSGSAKVAPNASGKTTLDARIPIPVSPVADDLADAPQRARGAGRGAKIAAIAAMVVFFAALALAIWRPFQKPSPPSQSLIAVLPFQNLSGDVRTRYFSDGMTEEIVDALLRTTQIRVVAPRSSFRLRNAGASKVANFLTATLVLSGSVQRNEDRVHVVAQLTDSTGAGIWSQTYDRTIAEAPSLQQDIAIQIADALNMRLSPSSLADAQKVNPAAYDHYLKGRDLFIQRDIPAALLELEQSVRLAPRFPRAWSTLAAARMAYNGYKLITEANNYDSSIERAAMLAAKRASMLDPNDGEALGVQAMVTSTSRLTEMDRLFARALKAEPNNTQLLNWYTAFLMLVGRNQEGADQMRRAYELDHLTPVIAWNFASDLLEQGQVQASKKVFELSRESGNLTDYFLLGAEYKLISHDWRGLAEYLRELPNYIRPADRAYLQLAEETAAALSADDSGKFAPLRARWVRRTLYENSADGARFLLALGDPGGALSLIERRVSWRRSMTLQDPGWDALFVPDLAPLRRDSRVPALLAKWGLFDYWRATNHWPDFCDEPGLPFDCRAEAAKFRRQKA